MKLLSTGNPKTVKGMVRGFNTYILHLAPSTLSGYQTCPKATPGCAAACLNIAGRGGMFKRGENTNAIQEARIRKTRMFFEQRALFLSQLVQDVELALRQSAKLGLTPVFRLNGTSDIAFEKIRVYRNGVEFRNIMTAFPDVQFYDYTKIAGRNVPLNYHLTFSAADGNDVDVTNAINNSMSVAVVFGNGLPQSYNGLLVIDGDESDLRFLDPRPVIVGLKAKGKAKKDQTGFVKFPVAVVTA
jgi:hypothetical protein